MTTPVSRWRQLTTSIALFDWLLNPLQDRDVPAIYALLADQSPTQHARYLNLGYWADATDMDSACNALVALVADTAQFNSNDCVLDVGFGFGDQDLYWWQHHRPRRIIGLNITPSQVVVARQRVAAQQLTAHIDLRQGSATAMPLAAGSVDKVVAVECAFHFRTRERFFAEAWRVLRPGGRLVLADIIPLPLVTDWHRRWLQQINWSLAASRFAMPGSNAYSIGDYTQRLAAAGFTQVEVRSIRDQVYLPLHAHLRTHPEVLARLHPLLRLIIRLSLPFDADTVYAGMDYVLASAVKRS